MIIHGRKDAEFGHIYNQMLDQYFPDKSLEDVIKESRTSHTLLARSRGGIAGTLGQELSKRVRAAAGLQTELCSVAGFVLEMIESSQADEGSHQTVGECLSQIKALNAYQREVRDILVDLEWLRDKSSLLPPSYAQCMISYIYMFDDMLFTMLDTIRFEAFRGTC